MLIGVHLAKILGRTECDGQVIGSGAPDDPPTHDNDIIGLGGGG